MHYFQSKHNGPNRFFSIALQSTSQEATFTSNKYGCFKAKKYNSSKGNLVFQGKNCRNFNSVPTLCLISTPRIEDNNEEYDLIVLTKDQMFIEGFEEGIEDTDKNLEKYQSQKKYLDHGRTQVLKSCSFYSKDLYKQRFVGFNPSKIMRENRELAFKLRRE